MNAESAHVGWGFWRWWVLASTVGFLIGGAMGSALFPARDDAVAFAMAFAVSGAVTGTARWLLLRRHLSRAGWWVLASAVGFTTFGAVYKAVYGVMGEAVGDAVVYTLAGAAVGITQCTMFDPAFVACLIVRPPGGMPWSQRTRDLPFPSPGPTNSGSQLLLGIPDYRGQVCHVKDDWLDGRRRGVTLQHFQ